MMRVQVLYFASLREKAGVTSETLTLDEGATVMDALHEVNARHQALSLPGGGVRWAVEHEFAQLTTPLFDGAELALLPPVSGG